MGAWHGRILENWGELSGMNRTAGRNTTELFQPASFTLKQLEFGHE